MIKKKVIIYNDIEDSFIKEGLNKFANKYKNPKYKIIYKPTTQKIFYSEISIFVSCSKILNLKDLSKSNLNVVVHPGKLPQERGSAIISWKMLRNEKKITITMFEPDNNLDSGDIIYSKSFNISKTSLIEEIRNKQQKITFDLIDKLLTQYPKINKKKQIGRAVYYKKRKAEDSEININKTLKSQFSLIRTCDNERYPAFFKYKNKTFVLKIFKK